MEWLLSILGLGFLMVVHESGHYLAARAFGMRVTKFSIGFGPTFFKVQPIDGWWTFTSFADRVKVRLRKHDPDKHGPTVFQVAMIPFLAYVQIAGMNPLEEVDPKDEGSYANASLIGRIVTIIGGSLANYLFASVFFFVALMSDGRLVQPTQFDVIPDRPAAAAGMQNGDKVLEVAGHPVTEWPDMAARISENPGRTIPIVVDRAGERLTFQVTPANENGQGRIGIDGKAYPATKVPVTASEAAVLSVKMPPKVVETFIVGLVETNTRKSDAKVSGPVGMVKEMAKTARAGIAELLFILGMLSAYLGAFNLLPLPALDGGRLMFLGYEATTRRRPNPMVEAQIHAVGLIMMLGLMLYVTFANDLGLGGGGTP
jgi:regulator of sigma E protease